MHGEAEEACGRAGPVAAAVEAEDELVEIGLQVLPPQAVIDAQRPCLQITDDPMNPGQQDVGRHGADDTRIVGDLGRP